MHYDRLTRLLHLFIALGISCQLGLGLVMHHPRPGRPGDGFYQAHEYLGLALLGLLVLHGLWAAVRRGAVPLGQLFPWFSPARYAPLLEDVRRFAGYMSQRRLPPGDAPSPLANAVQGLGLAAALLLAVTGTLLFLNPPPDGARLSGWMRNVKEVHEAFGMLLWGYLGVHAGMAILHQWAGHGTMTAMFSHGAARSQPMEH